MNKKGRFRAAFSLQSGKSHAPPPQMLNSDPLEGHDPHKITRLFIRSH